MARDITGDTYGRLTAVRKIGLDKRNKTIWEFQCDCGKTVRHRWHDVTNGMTSSCGCLKSDRSKKADFVSDEFIKVLIEAALKQSIEDWRLLCLRIRKGSQGPDDPHDGISIGELRNFFKGEWCHQLCGRVNPQIIINQLEKEFEEARESVI